MPAALAFAIAVAAGVPGRAAAADVVLFID
jgi:hypothetical protein